MAPSPRLPPASSIKDCDALPDVDGAADGSWNGGDGSQQPGLSEDPNLRRTASWFDVLVHSITAMIGAGVLGLPAAMAQLGWVGGVIFLAFSIWVSWHTYKLLVLMHEVPDLASKRGGIRRLDRYDQLAAYILGARKGKAVLLPFQLLVLVGIAVTYVVVGGDNLAAFAEGVAGRVLLGKWAYYIMFGGLQLLLSLLPSFDHIRLVSLLGALMSAAYCIIAIVMSATVRPGPSVNYNPAAVHRSPVERVMGIFNAMTTVFFAYGGHNVALEIQATIPIGGKHPLSTVPAMMRGVNVTFLVTGLCYFGVSILGFYAFGTGVTENVLMAFGQGPTHWVVTMANLMVVIHVAAAYQVYTQPVFSLIEARLDAAAAPAAGAAPPRCASLHLPVKVGLRLVYASLTTLVAVLVPFFGALMGFIGAVAITPTTFLLPALFWLLHKQPPRWGWEWAVNWALVWLTGLLGVLGAAGAVYIIATSYSAFRIFAA